MADQSPPPNIGNETLEQWSNRQVWSPNYTNPDGGDTFASLVNCINGVWGRGVRDELKQNNEAWACRHVTPLLLKIQSITSGQNWRASDDNAYAIQSGEFGTAGVLVPQYFWHLNGDNSNQGSGPATEIAQDDQTSGRAYSYVRVEGRPGGSPGDNVIGMRTFRKAVGFNSAYDSAIALTKPLSGSVTLRVCEWPQANEKIVLMAVRTRQIDDETGPTNRFNFEFGLGPSNGFFPGNDKQAYALYLRWISSDNIVETAVNEITDEESVVQGVGITPGYEWTLGFHRYENPASTWFVDFYVNGQKMSTWGPNALGSPSPGSATSIRLLIGAGNDGKQHAGGPCRNTMLRLGADDPSVVAPLMEYIYQKGAGFI